MQTYNYCNQAKTQRPPRYIKMTYKYLKEEKIIAVPFDKGLGFCLMSDKDYEEKLSKIASLKQFTPEITTRTNKKNPVGPPPETQVAMAQNSILDQSPEPPSVLKMDTSLLNQEHDTFQVILSMFSRLHCALKGVQNQNSLHHFHPAIVLIVVP